MSEDVVEGISPGDVDVAGLESRAVFGGTDGNARSNRRAGLRLSVNRLQRAETGQEEEEEEEGSEDLEEVGEWQG